MAIETAVFFGLLLLVLGIALVFGNPFKGMDLTTKDETKLDQDNQILEEVVEPAIKVKRVYKKKPKVEVVEAEKAPVKKRISKKQ